MSMPTHNCAHDRLTSLARLRLRRYKSKAPGCLPGPERFYRCQMDHTVTDQARKPSKHPFFSVKKWIKGLMLRRPMKDMLLALVFLVDGVTLASDKYPITIDRLAEEATYSRTQTFEILNDLERAGLVERIRHRRQLPSGEWTNDPTTYRIVVDESERTILASVKASEPPRERHPKKERVPRRKAQPAETTVPQEATESSAQPPAPIPVPERVKANVAPAYENEMLRPPQDPNDDREVTNFGDDIVRCAEEALDEVARVAKPRTIQAAKIGIYAFRYSLAVHALDIRDEYLVEESELLESVYEWVRKVVAKNVSCSPDHLVGVLRTFFDGKGDGIRNVRRNLASA